ncbi:hypothetical protein KSP40_PGU009249 [Platanthera guangdongensis]|uniref:Uncharacterized protein n=1 Tax=Platanthera guangdongensis TaxID=2320717 RepID=A0ABR2MPP4_9ASPA
MGPGPKPLERESTNGRLKAQIRAEVEAEMSTHFQEMEERVPDIELHSDVLKDQATEKVLADDVVVEKENKAQFDDEKCTYVHDGGSGMDIDYSSDQENFCDAQVDAQITSTAVDIDKMI